MKTEIYLTRLNTEESRSLIIDGDEHSVWAYVLDIENQIEFEGFLCSRGTMVNSVTEVKDFINKDLQPPLLQKFANEFSVQTDIDNENLKIVWKSNIIRIFVDDIEFLRMNTLSQLSYSKAIRKSGVYGSPLAKNH